MEPSEAVYKFLRSVAPKREAELYLRHFRQAPKARFAAIVIDSQAMTDNADAVAVDLRFLNQLQLTPVVVLGLDSPDQARQQAQILHARLLQQGVRVTRPHGLADTEAITQATVGATIPLLCANGNDLDNRIQQLGSTLSALHTHKLIFLHPAGGIRLDGQRVSIIDVKTEADHLLKQRTLSPRERWVIEVAQQLILNHVQHQFSVAVTSPINLLQELFTVRGAGTLLRNATPILRYDHISEVDSEQLRSIFEASFGRTVKEDVLQRDYARCYLDKNGQCAALLTHSPTGGYLSKFAVTSQAQGEGLGRDLFRAVCDDYPKLLWRAKADNPIAPWYAQQCHSLHRGQPWTVYMRGIAPNDLASAVHFAVRQPNDFITSSAGAKPHSHPHCG